MATDLCVGHLLSVNGLRPTLTQSLPDRAGMQGANKAVSSTWK